MAGGIKGITVKIGGDTTELGRALSQATTKSTALQKELKGVNTLLKMDPSNVTLLKQKADLLKQSIGETKTKLESLKAVLAKADSGEIKLTEEEYRNLQREIASTETKSKALKDELKEFGSVGAQQVANVGKQFEEFGTKAENAGKKFLPVSAGILALGTVAVSTTAEFDSAMSNVQAISGATGDDMDALRTKAREMGESTKFSAKESADAMSYMAMAGWKTEDMISGISGIMSLASASGEDLATTSDIVTDALTGFGKSAEESGKLADIMAVTSSNANTNVALMGETFKYASSVAGAYGYSMEDVAEMTGLMANAGIKGSEAGTSLRSIMSRLATDAGASSKSLGALGTLTEKLGVEFYNADGTMRPFKDVINETRTAFKGLTQEEQANYAKKIAGQNAMSGFLALMNASEEDVGKLETALASCDGVAEGMANTMNDNLAGQVTILKSQLQELAISFGEILMPTIRSVVGAIQNLVDKFNNLSPEQQKVILIISGIVASIAPLLIAIGKISTGVGAIMQLAPKIVSGVTTLGGGLTKLWGIISANPIALIITAITALVAGFIYLWNNCESFREFWIGLWEKIKGVIQPVIDFLTSAFSTAWETIKTVWEAVSGFFSTLFTGIKDSLTPVIDAVVGAFKSAWELIKVVWDLVSPYFTAIWDGIKAVFSVVKTYFGTLFKGAWNAIKIVWDVVVAYFKLIWENIKAVFCVVKDVLLGFFKTAWTAIKAVWDVVCKYFETIWNTIKGIFSVVKDVLTGNFKGAWEGIKGIFAGVGDFFKTVWESIKKVFSGVASFFSGVFSSAWTCIKKVFNNVGEFFTTLWDKVVALFTTIGTAIGDAISGAVKGAINLVLSGAVGIINGFITAINCAISVINAIPGVEISKLKKLEAPQLAQGGILKRGQVGILEGDGAEAVVPLEKNTEWTNKVARQMSEYTQQSNANNALLERLDGIYNKLDKLKQSIVLDTGVLVGETIDQVDSALNNVNDKVVRGW